MRSTKRADTSTSRTIRGTRPGIRRGTGHQAEVGRHRDPQPPRGLELAVVGQRAGGLGALLHLVRVLEDRLAELVTVSLRVVRQDEPLAEHGLERRDPPRHRGDGDAKPLRSFEKMPSSTTRAKTEVIRLIAITC